MGELARARLADDRHLDLTGILERVLDLGGDFAGQERGHVVADFAGLHHHAHITAGLHREAALDTGATHGDLFECLEALDVLLETLAACSGPCGRDRVGSNHQDRLDRVGFDVVVMGLDGMRHSLTLAELAAELPRDDGMRSFDLVCNGLANVVEERSSACDPFVDSKFDRHDRGEVRALQRMLEDVLTVRGAVIEPSKDRQQFGIETRHVRLERGLFASLADLLLDLLLGGVVRLLDASRMDTTIRQQILERDARDLTTHTIESGQDDSAGRVVDDHVNARRGLERSNVATLAANDATLEVVGWQLDGRNRGCGGIARGGPLNAGRDNRASATIAVLLGLFFDAADELRGVMPSGLLHAAEQLRTSLVGCHAADTLQLPISARLRLAQRGLCVGQRKGLLCCCLLPLQCDGFAFGSEILAGDKPLLETRDLAAALIEALFELAAQLK